MKIETSIPDYYITNGKYKWKVTDQYGYNINLTKFKLNKLLNVKNPQTFFNKDIIIHYDICLTSINPNTYRQIMLIYKPEMNKLKVYSLLDTDETRITLPCDSLEQAEQLINLICKGEDLEPYPVHKT